MHSRILFISIWSLMGVLSLAGSASVVSAQATAQQPLPFLGRWKMNAAKSDLQTTRLVFTRAASGDITMTIQGTTQTFRMDGKERPGMLGSTTIWTETGPRSWRTVYRMANADNNIDQYTLSEDGKALTMRTEFLLPTRSEQTMTFTRVSGGPGLMGTWQTKTLQNSDTFIEMSSTNGKRVDVNWSFGGRATAPIDGTEVPVTGPPTSVAPGMTASLKVTGSRSFDLSMKMNGANVATGTFVVSAEGKTMSVDSLFGPPGPAQERAKTIFEKQ
jgi:hypothetical protein